MAALANVVETVEAPPQYTPNGLADAIGEDYFNVKTVFERLRSKGKLTGSWSKSMVFDGQQLSEVVADFATRNTRAKSLLLTLPATTTERPIYKIGQQQQQQQQKLLLTTTAATTATKVVADNNNNNKAEFEQQQQLLLKTQQQLQILTADNAQQQQHNLLTTNELAHTKSRLADLQQQLSNGKGDVQQQLQQQQQQHDKLLLAVQQQLQQQVQQHEKTVADLQQRLNNGKGDVQQQLQQQQQQHDKLLRELKAQHATDLNNLSAGKSEATEALIRAAVTESEMKLKEAWLANLESAKEREMRQYKRDLDEQFDTAVAEKMSALEDANAAKIEAEKELYFFETKPFAVGVLLITMSILTYQMSKFMEMYIGISYLFIALIWAAAYGFGGLIMTIHIGNNADRWYKSYLLWFCITHVVIDLFVMLPGTEGAGWDLAGKIFAKIIAAVIFPFIEFAYGKIYLKLR